MLIYSLIENASFHLFSKLTTANSQELKFQNFSALTDRTSWRLCLATFPLSDCCQPHPTVSGWLCISWLEGLQRWLQINIAQTYSVGQLPQELKAELFFFIILIQQIFFRLRTLFCRIWKSGLVIVHPTRPHSTSGKNQGVASGHLMCYHLKI